MSRTRITQVGMVHSQFLLAICFFLVGCGGEEKPSGQQLDREVKQAEVNPDVAEVMLEITGWEHHPYSHHSQGLFIESVVHSVQEQFGEAARIEIDDVVHAGKFRVFVEPGDQADVFFHAAKELVDSVAREAVAAQLKELKTDVEIYAKAADDSRRQLRKLQEQYRGEPKDTDTQLLFRLFDKHIQEALENQIAAEDHVKAVERQIDRERYPTLLRVR